MNEVEEKLDRILRLLAIDIARGRPAEDQIRVLDKAGFKPSEIASLLDKTSNTVRVTLHAIRKKLKKEVLEDGNKDI